MAGVQSEAKEDVLSPAPKELKLEGAALITALTKQVEFYFSKTNLQQDTYLLSQMNVQKYVPIEVIASFRKVKILTEDRDVLLGVMKQCAGLSLDETGTMVRPTHKMERNTLILRDIPSTTAVEDIKEIFEHKDCANAVSVRPDYGDTWFVTFENEEQCVDTAMALSNIQFQGKPIRCRIKTQNLVGSYYSGNSNPAGQQFYQDNNAPQTWNGGAGASPTAAPYYPGNPYTAGAVFGGQSTGAYNPYQGGPYPQWNGQQYAGNQQFNGATKGRGRGNKNNGAGAAAPAGAVPAGGTARKERKPRVGTKGTPAQGAGAASFRGEGRGSERRGEGRGEGRGRRQGQRQAEAPPPPADLGLDNFPVLGSKSPAKNSKSEGDQDKEDEGKQAFVKFDREYFAAVIVKLVSEGYGKPEAMLDNASVIRNQTLTESQLLEPMPVMYPASPSPLLAAQPHHSSAMMPFLDLNSYGNPYLPPDNTAKPAAAVPAVVTSTAATETGPAKPSAAAIVAAAEGAEKKPAAAKAAAPKAAPKYAQKGDKKDKGDRKRGGPKEKEGRREGKGKAVGKPKYAQKPNTNAKSSSREEGKKVVGVEKVEAVQQEALKPAPKSQAGKLSYAEMARRAAMAKEEASKGPKVEIKKEKKQEPKEKKEEKKEKKEKKVEDKAPTSAPAKVQETEAGAAKPKPSTKMSFAKMVAGK